MSAPVFQPTEQGLIRRVVDRLRYFGGVSGRAHTELSAPQGWNFITSRNGTFLTYNAHYDEVNAAWNRYDTALTATALVVTEAGVVQHRYAAAGANPITWTSTNVAIAPVLRLSYAQTADVLNGAALTAHTFADVTTAQNFTVSSTATFLLFTVRLGTVATFAGSAFSYASRALLDGAIAVPLSGGASAAAGYASAESSSFWYAGLAPGTHTIKIQVVASQNATAYLRAASAPNYEFCGVQVVELNP